MIRLEKVKELLGSETMSDDEAERVRDACYSMAELVFERWRVDRSKRLSDSDATRNREGDDTDA